MCESLSQDGRVGKLVTENVLDLVQCVFVHWFCTRLDLQPDTAQVITAFLPMPMQADHELRSAKRFS